MQKFFEDNIFVITGGTAIIAIGAVGTYTQANPDPLIYGLLFSIIWWAVCKFCKYASRI